jgi:hypothetical protein
MNITLFRNAATLLSHKMRFTAKQPLKIAFFLMLNFVPVTKFWKSLG